MNTRLAVKFPGLFVCLLAVACCLWTTDSRSDEPANAEKLTAESMIAKEPGQVRDDNELKMKSVWCPPGFVTMEQVEALEEPATKKDETADDDSIGEPAPEPRKRTAITPVKVFVTKGYWLGKFEVTQSEWKQVMATEPWQGKECTKEGDDFPATCVTWGEAIEFCRKLTELEQKAGRVPGGWEYTLPTEAQWERACRAGTKTNFSFGDEESKLGEYAWFSDNAARAGEEYAHRVGQKKPNPWGLHDMHGDVREWCRDWYGVKLPGGREPEVTKGGALRVIRGGSWSNVARGCRSAERFWYDPSNQYVLLGFRVALSSSGTK